ncbi:acyl-CoA-binding protein [Roseivirga sp.]|uniref:acyl-CoA-binding protein n=1 Tax=Roseivirga sp. TaxID=1964215 RepID=UPI003B52B30E
MSLQESFENAVKSAHSLSERPSNEDLLKIYSLYKQATEGDNQEEPPSGFDFKAAAKHNAWKKLSGLSKDEAMTQYIDLIEQLKSA